MATKTHTLLYGLHRPAPAGVHLRITGKRAETIRPTKAVIWYDGEGDRYPVLHFYSGKKDRTFEGVKSYASLEEAIEDLPWLEEGLRKFDRVVAALKAAVRA